MTGATGAGRAARRRSALLAAGLAGAAVLLSGCADSPARPSAEASYGDLPSWLPSDTSAPNSMLVADVRHPAVTSEGDVVEVHLATGSVRVSVVGPEVPGEGLPVQPEDTTCTWTVTLSDASTVLPVGAGQFNTLDHLGTVYPVHAGPGQGGVPATIRPGQVVRFSLRNAMPTGEGVMRYSGGTSHVLASWDFVVEND